MMTVLLADDEPMIVKGLQKLIDWKKLNYRLIGTAANGEEALEIIRKENPHLLISDINMPHMNGIELLKKLKKEDFRTQVIFISGFQDFEYAHAALKFGACDYLLKPIDEKQLEAAIVKAVSKENSYPYSHDEPSLNSLELGEQVISDFSDYETGYYTIINCQIDESLQGTLSRAERDILHFSTINYIRDYFSPLNRAEIIDRKNRILVLLCHEQRNALLYLQKSLLEELARQIRENLNESLIISTGKIVDGVNSINESYLSSLETMNLRYYLGENSVLYYSGTNAHRYTMDNLYVEQSKIIEALVKYDKDLSQNIDSYLTVLKDISYGNKEATISYCLGTLVFIKKNLEQKNIDSPLLNFDDRKILSDLHSMDLFDTLKLWLHNMLDNISEEIRNNQDRLVHPDIFKIKTYISENYRENITLQDLSNLIYLHPNYLSGYFKKQTGQNFKDYLTDVRMEQAENMLLSTDLKVYEIAEQVGFTDFRHFSEVFKKKHGVSPREYKKRI